MNKTPLLSALQRICIVLSSGAGIGYLPAPGSAATLLIGIPLAALVHYAAHGSPIRSLLFLSGLTIISYGIITTALETTTDHDPSWIVLDEVVGFCWATGALPITTSATPLIAAVILFRFFDISKLGPVGWSEQLPRASGVLCDDIVAGICTRLVLCLAFL